MKNQQSLAQEATVLGGPHLDCRRLVDLARSGGPVDVDEAAADLVSQSWSAIDMAAGRRPVYGRTTGVGANRSISVDGPRGDKDVNLLRSHATGSGPWLPATTVRAAVLVRLNQLLRGGSGMHPDIVQALVSALNGGRLPKVRHRDRGPERLRGHRPWTHGGGGAVRRKQRGQLATA
jgi:histidine ammonia-lyase